MEKAIGPFTMGMTIIAVFHHKGVDNVLEFETDLPDPGTIPDLSDMDAILEAQLDLLADHIKAQFPDFERSQLRLATKREFFEALAGDRTSGAIDPSTLVVPGGEEWATRE